ncbi:PREDICTED: uncharacterized protein LOC109147547 [Ipomoea nil]|uniref:uncharacterized protein LOC109147547 n=1 Tax=Ipomoea nil TaxID=35883 RepID=UPI000901A32C|nr:PREDICTED: uncharacterized protein LOC109147547 [Ipomoea nil]
MKAALVQHRVDVDAMCSLCNLHEESLKHLLCECQYVTPLWAEHTDILMPDVSVNFVSWMSNCIANGSMTMKLKCIALCWSRWRGRNDVVWNQVPWQEARIRTDAGRYFQTWQEQLQGSPYANRHANPAIANRQPDPSSGDATIPTDVMQLYVDAAVFKDTNQASFGVVMLNNIDVYVATLSGPVRCMNDVHLAEAFAIKEALSWAKARDLRKVMVKTDCQAVCNLLNGSLLDLSFAGCVINDCRELKRHFDMVSFCYVSRSVNRLAHTLARAARSDTDPHCWISTFPSCIASLLQ